MDVNKKDQISDVCLLQETVQPFKQLSGFQKHHRVPHMGSSSDIQFLADIAAADLDAELQKTFANLRSGFGFKRKELTVSGPAEGGGMIVTPYFTYELNVFLLEEDPSQVAWRSAVANILQPEQIFTDSFQRAFGNRFSVLEVSTSAPLDIEAIIDHIEDAELDSVNVNYDKDISWCEIFVAKAQATVKIRDCAIRVTSLEEVSPRRLLEKFLNIQEEFLASFDCGSHPFMADTP